MNRRRHFLKTAVALGVAPFMINHATPKKTSSHGIIRPKRLEQGDTVAVIAPASSTFENEDIKMAMEVVASLGFKVKPGSHLFDRKGYLAGEDQDRANDLNRMFADPEVKGIFTLRGGYGTPRLLPYVDFDLIAKNPKPLVGYSDITALLNAIHLKTGLITFHGPIANQNYTEYTLERFYKILRDPLAPMVLGDLPPFIGRPGFIDRENRLVRVAKGKARGRLTGGNLSLLVKMMGTPYQPDFAGKILVLEDVGEKPYRIDGMLTHLWLTGKLNELAGIVLGKFTDCDPDGPGSLSLETIFHERLTPLGIPVLRGLMIGHVANQCTFPIGAEAELDVAAGTLTLLEPGVS